jgi:hypothetical protein
MADIFTFVKGNKKKVYNIAGGTEEEAIKYVRYLHRNALFGTHTGLPQKIRNSKMNESLVSNIGDYSVLDVYAYPQTKCIIGTVVNFHISNDVNPLGETYVYPCTDRNKPMGYMISDATSEELGVCLVHGVLEVPLYYFSGSTEEKKDFVEYDIENACFKFSDSGYPVFNVYQDVDGDWIAIILFGDVSSDYEYDGPFAVSVAGVTGSTTYVNVNSGDVLFNDIIGTYDEDLTAQVALNTGESVWLKTSITGNTHAYDLIATSTPPIDGSTVFYTELAKNVDGNIVQNQYGDIRYSRTKLIAGSNRIILSPANGLGDVTIDVNESVIGGGTFYTPNYTQLAILGDTVPEGYLGQTFVLPVRAGTVGFFDDGGNAKAVWTDKDGSTSVQLASGILYPSTKDGWLRVSVIDGGTSSGACLSIQDSTGNIPIYKYGSFGEKNIEYLEGIGISITGQTDSTTGGYTGKKIINMDTAFSVLVTSPTATISLTGSTNSLTITAGSGVSISANGSSGIIISATGGTVTPYVQDLTHSFSTGTATLGLTDSAITVDFIAAGNTYIESGGNGEIIIGSTSGNFSCASTGITGVYSLYISDSFDSKVYLKEGVGISLSMSGSTITITGTTYTGGTGIDITNGTITNLLTGDGTTIQVSNNIISYIGEIPSPQNLSVSVSGNTANVGITDGTGFSIVADGNTYINKSSDGFVIGSTFSEFEYDGPFAVKVDHVDETTPTTLYIVVNTGVITYEKKRKNINAVTTSTSLSSGQSYWLKYNTVSGAVSYYKASSPQADSNNVIQVKLAENVGGVLKQVQFGEIILSKPDLTWEYDTDEHIISLGVTGSTKSITMYGKNGIVLSNDNTSNTIAIYLSGTIGTVTGITSSVASNSATISTVGGTGSVILSGGSNTYIESGDNGEIIIGSTVSGNTGTVTGITSSIFGTTAFVSTIGGTGGAVFYGIGGTTISSGENGEIVIGSTVGGGSDFAYTGSFKVDCWDTYDEDEQTTYHHYRIYDTNNRDDDYSFAGWVHIGNQKYHVFSVSDDTFVDGDVIYLVGTFNDSNTLSQLTFTKIQTFFPTINDNQFCVRICYATNGKMYQTQYGDIVQPARLVGDGETVEIHSNVISAIGGGGGGTVQGLYSAIKGGTPAICITGSTTYVPIAGGINTYTERDSSGAIIVGSTVNVSGSVGFPDYGGNREPVSFGTEYGPYNYDVWLIGECGIYGGTDANIVLHLGGRTITLYDYHTNGQTVTNYIPVCIPVSASSQRSIRVVKGNNDNSDMELYIYRCL